MNLEIIRILKPKASLSGGNVYYRVDFKEEKTGKWYKTDLCPNYRNYTRWARLLRVGNVICNVRLKDETTIDADSRPILLTGRKRYKTQQHKKMSFNHLNQLGVFDR